MTDEKPERGKTRSYKVLRPQVPTPAEFKAGQTFAKYIGLGEYQAESPEGAVEMAAEEFADLEGGRFVAVALTGWQERDAIAEVVRAWKVTRPSAEELSVEDAAAVGEPEEPTQEMETVVEEPTVEAETVEAAISDEEAAEVEQAALEAAEAEDAAAS